MVDRVLVTLDGVVRDVNAPLLYADDIGILRGDGVFESVLVRDGRACAVELHLARLRRSAAAVNLPEPDLGLWRSAVDIAVQAWGSGSEGKLRMVLSRGRDTDDGAGPPPDTTAFVLVTPLPQRSISARAQGVSVVTLARGTSTERDADPPWLLRGAKTLSYAMNMAALRYAADKQAQDVIFTSIEKRVLEGPRSSVVIQRDRQLITPPVRNGVLPGITAHILFEEATRAGWNCRYEPFFVADLITADSVWLLSSVTLAARVSLLDGLRMSPPDCAGEIVELVDRGMARLWSIADWK